MIGGMNSVGGGCYSCSSGGGQCGAYEFKAVYRIDDVVKQNPLLRPDWHMLLQMRVAVTSCVALLSNQNSVRFCVFDDRFRVLQQRCGAAARYTFDCAEIGACDE